MDNRHRAEEFFAEGTHLAGHAGEDRRRVVGAGTVGAAAAQQDLRPVGDRVLDQLVEFVDACRGGQRTELRCRVGRVTGLPAGHAGNKFPYELVVDAVLHEKTLRRSAGLTAIGEPTDDGRGCRSVDIGVRRAQ